MGSFGIWHWLIVLVVVVLIFGTGKLKNMMGDIGKGVKEFKKGIAADDDPADKNQATMAASNSSMGNNAQPQPVMVTNQPAMAMQRAATPKAAVAKKSAAKKPVARKKPVTAMTKTIAKSKR